MGVDAWAHADYPDMGRSQVDITFDHLQSSVPKYLLQSEHIAVIDQESVWIGLAEVVVLLEAVSQPTHYGNSELC